MLRAGLAIPLIIEPNNRHEGLLMEAAAEARQKRKGVWGDLDTLAPALGERGVPRRARTRRSGTRGSAWSSGEGYGR
ncbi:MAG: hypothetical protein R3B51_05200 [Thermodesulfobacteriota bacterium]